MTFLSLLIHPAFACGGFVPKPGEIVSSDAQQALYDIGSDSVTVTYRARYRGDATDFAWVVAVPGPIAEVGLGDAERLDAIQLESAPVVDVDPSIGTASGCGCGGSAGLNSKGDATGDDGGVEVTGHGFAGNLEYTTLTAENADSLNQWLTDNGYDTSLIADSVTGYVEDVIGYEWVAVRLVPELTETGSDTAGGSDGAPVLVDPLEITYGPANDGTLHASFPAKLGVSSSAESVRTEIYVLATGFATLSGWDVAEGGGTTAEQPYDIIVPDYVSPEGMYGGLLSSVGGTVPRMFLAYANAYDDAGASRWLTRYDSIVSPATNTLDPVFTDSGKERVESTDIYSQEEGAYQTEHPDSGEGHYTWLFPLGLFGAIGWRRRMRDAAVS